jgi:hypothetical protein
MILKIKLGCFGKFVLLDKMRRIKQFNFFLFALLGWFIFTALCIIKDLNAAQPDKGISEQVMLSEKRLALLSGTIEKLKALADDPMPKKTTPSEQKELNAYSKWLKNAIDQLNLLAKRWETYLQNKGLSSARDKLTRDPQVAEDLRLLNLQYLLLRNKIYQENKDFQISSNFLKKKRETVRSLTINLK